MFAYYAGIVLNTFAFLLCSKACWHNRLKPKHYSFSQYSAMRPVIMLKKFALQEFLILVYKDEWVFFDSMAERQGNGIVMYMSVVW